MTEISTDDEKGPVLESGKLTQPRCPICGARVNAGSFQSESTEVRYCPDECVVIAKAFGVFGKPRIPVSHLREADEIIWAWEKLLQGA